MAYLDDTGLAYFWGKIKAWANSVFALLGHTHPASDVTLMTGYSKPASGSAIAASDTLNQAVGKLEAKVDVAIDDSGYVHIAGDETVTGIKTFTGLLHDSTNQRGFEIRHPDAVRGTAPAENKHISVSCLDASGAQSGAQGAHGRFGLFNAAVFSSGTVECQIIAYKNEAGSTRQAAMGAGYTLNDVAYAFCPSTPLPSVRNSNTDIVTRDFIPNDVRIVHASGVETITGSKRFYDCAIDFQTSIIDKGDAPSIKLYKNVVYADKNGVAGVNRFGAIEFNINTDKSTEAYFVAYKNVSGSSDNITVGAHCDADGTGYGFVYGGNFHLTDSHYVRLINNSVTRGTAPSSTLYFNPIRSVDSSGKTLSSIYTVYDTAKANYISLLAFNGTTTVDSSEQLGIGFDGSGNVFTCCPTPAANSNTTNIATTEWVRTFCNTTAGFVDKTSAQTISGTKTFSGTIVMSTYWAMKRDVSTSSIVITGGTGTSSSSGGKVEVYGVSSSSNAGYAQLQGGNSSGYRKFEARPLSLLLHTNDLYFPENSTFSNATVMGQKTSGAVYIYSGTQNFDGAGLLLFGRSNSSNAGQFYLRASTKSSSSSSSGTSRALSGTPDGSIFWNGQALQTSSDERLKRDFSSVDDGILDGWGSVDWLQFKFRDAVEEKGDRARFHVGLVAQRVDRTFLDAGLDVKRYGIVCHELSEPRTVRSIVTDMEAYTDEDGVFHEAVTHYDEEFVPGTDEWTVRYTEALCMEAAYMRRENARLKERLAALEDRLAALELRLGSE